MSAPKPRVSRTVTFIWQPGKAAMAHRWTWVCECGASDPSPYGLVLHRLAMDGAIEHSRKHTAERIAEYLEDRSCIELDAADLSFIRCRHTGRAYAFSKSAHLIREYLVGRTS